MPEWEVLPPEKEDIPSANSSVKAVSPFGKGRTQPAENELKLSIGSARIIIKCPGNIFLFLRHTKKLVMVLLTIGSGVGINAIWKGEYTEPLENRVGAKEQEKKAVPLVGISVIRITPILVTKENTRVHLGKPGYTIDVVDSRTGKIWHDDLSPLPTGTYEFRLPSGVKYKIYHNRLREMTSTPLVFNEDKPGLSKKDGRVAPEGEFEYIRFFYQDWPMPAPPQ